MGPPLQPRSEMLIPAKTTSDNPVRTPILQNTIMSQARLQATLQSVAAPYNKVCPNSLLGRKCHVERCDLLHLCPHFTQTSTPSDVDEEEFPALGGSIQKSNEVNGLSGCKKEDGSPVKEGEVCSSTGQIHLKPSCMAEVEGVSCHFWSSPPRQSHAKSHSSSSIDSLIISTIDTNKKFKSVTLNYNYTAPTADLRQPSSAFAALQSQNDSTNSRKTSSEYSRSTKQPTQAEIREAHFKTCVHERDGIGRDVWHARVMNAELRGVHESGIWGVKQKEVITSLTSTGIDWSAEMEDEDESLETETDISSLAAYEKIGVYGLDGCDERDVDEAGNEVLAEEKRKKEEGNCWGAQRNPLKKYVPVPEQYIKGKGQ